MQRCNRSAPARITCKRYTPRLEALEVRVVPAEFFVTTTTDGGSGSLRQAILDANATPEDDVIGMLAGNYVLTRTGADEDLGLTGDLDIRGNMWIVGEGQGTSTQIFGNFDRVFHIHAGTVGFSDLAILQGLAVGVGGGMLVEPSSTVYMVSCEIRDNEVTGNSVVRTALGGGIYARNSALWLFEVAVDNNVAAGPLGSAAVPTGGTARGGGLYLGGGSLFASDIGVVRNRADGGTGFSGQPAPGGEAEGAGIYATDASVRIAFSNIYRNGARAGRGGGGLPGEPGGSARGGGLYLSGGDAVLDGIGVVGNNAWGGDGGQGTLSPGGSGAPGGNGGQASGGGIFVSRGFLYLSGGAVGNRVDGGAGAAGGRGTTAAGGTGGAGGLAQGGGIHVDSGTVAIANADIVENGAFGGTAGNAGVSDALGPGVAGLAGRALGAGISAASGVLTYSQAWLYSNLAWGGQGASVGSGAREGGAGWGGGIYVALSALVEIRGATITANAAGGGRGLTEGPGVGGGVYITLGAYTCVDSQARIEGNVSSTSDPDVFGHYEPC
jgi:hypothetical protein